VLSQEEEDVSDGGLADEVMADDRERLAHWLLTHEVAAPVVVGLAGERPGKRRRRHPASCVYPEASTTKINVHGGAGNV